jgi:hypothetical protein
MSDQAVELPIGEYVTVVNSCLGYINQKREEAQYGGELQLIDFIKAEQGVVSDGEIYLVVLKVLEAGTETKKTISFDCRESVATTSSELDYNVEGLPLPVDIMPPDWVAAAQAEIAEQFGPDPMMNILPPVSDTGVDTNRQKEMISFHAKHMQTPIYPSCPSSPPPSM